MTTPFKMIIGGSMFEAGTRIFPYLPHRSLRAQNAPAPSLDGNYFAGIVLKESNI